MPRLRLLILFFLCLLALATQAHANYAFTHSDHLGSASWITDDAARPMQYIHYAPYGELIANQSLNGYDERYKFTGKERDAETGYDFFGARYLAQQLGIWTSPDPLLDKYIFASPYMYCNGNPIKYMDSDGRDFDEANEKIAQRIEAKCNRLIKRIKDEQRLAELNTTLQDIQSMRENHDYEFQFASTNGKVASSNGVGKDEPTTLCGGTKNGKQIIIMFSNIRRIDGTTAHEVRHGGQIARREFGFDKMCNPYNYGVMKEVDAYRAQWAWQGSLNPYIMRPDYGFPIQTTIDKYDDINANFVSSISKSQLENIPLYPPTGINLEVWHNH